MFPHLPNTLKKEEKSLLQKSAVGESLDKKV